LLVRVRAAPVGGQANEALCRLIAKRLRIGAGRAEVVRGLRSRDKVVRVQGVDAPAVRRTLGLSEKD
jgi:uncharacterized protein YggU (UPF0235/DUF167 family)